MTAEGNRFESLNHRDPSRIGSFTLLGRLGAGAMGRVYLGRSTAGRLFAVKTIRAEFADDPDFRIRFAHEVTAASKVSGVFTAPVVAADPQAETPWLATAYVPAPSLNRLVRKCGPLPVAAVRWLAAGCAEALESIHEVGLIHRDLKPSNVLVSLDGPMVIDFGVARAVERAALTMTHQPVGTPAYMAPEQAKDTHQVSPAADVFALGSTLVFAATGHAPYRGGSITDVLVKLATEPPDLTRVPAQLLDLVASCLARDPAARPTPAELLTELAPFTHMDAGQQLARALLPESATALIEDYLRTPELAAAHEPRQDAEETFGSTGPERSGESTRRPWTRLAGAQRSAMAVVAVAGVAALVGLAGGFVGYLINDSPPSQNTNTARPAEMVGEPPPPLRSGLNSRASAPTIWMSQPHGDKYTVFVVQGAGWAPGQQITVQVKGRPASPIKPITDRLGTFNYAINQTHEFWAGPIPDAVYVVKVSGGGHSTSADFRVDLPQLGG
jgi:serine/threonine protein kinase